MVGALVCGWFGWCSGGPSPIWTAPRTRRQCFFHMSRNLRWVVCKGSWPVRLAVEFVVCFELSTHSPLGVPARGALGGAGVQSLDCACKPSGVTYPHPHQLPEDGKERVLMAKGVL